MFYLYKCVFNNVSCLYSCVLCVAINQINTALSTAAWQYKNEFDDKAGFNCSANHINGVKHCNIYLYYSLEYIKGSILVNVQRSAYIYEYNLNDMYYKLIDLGDAYTLRVHWIFLLWLLELDGSRVSETCFMLIFYYCILDGDSH